MSTVDVENEVDKVFDAAVEQFRGELIELGRDVERGEIRFWTAEKRFSASVVALACQLLPVLLKLFDHGAKYVEYDGELWRRGTERQTATYRSVWGAIEVDRWVYLKRGQAGGEQLVAMDEQAGLLDGEWTPHCAEAIGRMVQSVPSREAKENMQTVNLLPYSRSSFDRVARRLGEGWEADRVQLEDTLIEAVEIPPQAAAISVAFDRVRIEMDETERDPEQWPNGREQPREIQGRMAYCATVTLHDLDGEPLWTNRYGRVSDQPPKQDVPGPGEWIIREQVREDVNALLERAPRLEQRTVVLTDGGPELERMVDELFPDWPRLCDMRHLDSYLADALEAAGLDEESRHEQRREWKHRLEREDESIEEIEQKLNEWSGRPAVDAALTYIDNRRERMRYARARADNLPVASGHVEATCKSLVQIRMRRSGQRWTKSAAQHVLNLRTLALSDTWDEGMASLMEKQSETVTRHDKLCERYAA
jgi:hypothetical protein